MFFKKSDINIFQAYSVNATSEIIMKESGGFLL